MDKSMSKIEINTFSDLVSKGITPEILFWVGCAGSFDDRQKKSLNLLQIF